MNTWLSDAHRGVVLGIAGGALGVLMVGSAVYVELVPQEWGAIEADPAAWDGKEVLVSLYTVETIEGPDRFVLRHGVWTVPVEGPSADLRVGVDLSVRGVYRADDDTLVQTWREFAPLRQRKRALGIGSILVLAALWPSFFRRHMGLLVSRA